MVINLIDINKEKAAYAKLSEKLSASVFNTTEWMNMFSNLNIYGIYNDNKELIGSFYFYPVKKYGLKANITPPFTPHNGLFFENRAENSSNINSFNKSIVSEISEFIDKINSGLTVFALPAGNLETQPFTWKNMDVKVKYTYHIDLTKSEETLLANLSSEKRKSLNKAKSDNLNIVRENVKKVVWKVMWISFFRGSFSKKLVMLYKIL